MTDYYSTKRISAVAATKLEALVRGHNVPMATAEENPDGYAITYPDGYRSWCPRATFDRDYQPATAMSFGHAIAALKAGELVARAGWNGKGQWLIKIDGHHWDACLPSRIRGQVEEFRPFIGIRTVDGQFVPWLASQTDMLADDWTIVTGE